MKCFEWLTHVSDYLDGALPTPLAREADSHVGECGQCSERLRHYKILLQSVSSQPRTTLPSTARKSLTSLPKAKGNLTRAKWDALPWYSRKGIEGAVMIALIVTVIAAVPKIRSIYEGRLERNLNDLGDGYSLGDIDSEAKQIAAAGGAAQLSRGKLAPGADDESEGDDYSGDGEESSGREVKAGASEIWRFSLRTDSPYEMRPKIVQILTELKLAANTPGIGGIEAPGGIQFDLLIARSAVPQLKAKLQHLAPHASAEDSEGEAFTWYKNESKRRIPDGKTRIVIWLSQM